MQPPIDHAAVAKRESKLLISVAAGFGCLLLLCVIITAVAGFMALTWTLQGHLGPGGGSIFPDAPALLAPFV
jgi:hypothetical protein